MRPVPSGTAGKEQHIRVLHLDTGREWRGGQRQVLLLAGGLRARGHEPLVVVVPRSPLHNRLKTEGVAAATIRMRAQLDLFAVRRLRRLIAYWRPAIVHAHDPRGHSLAMTALVGRRNDIPLVVTRRSPLRPRGAVRHGRRVARFIAISGGVRDALVAGGVDSSRISLVYPGVARPAVVEPRDWRRECGWPADAVVGGVLGHLATTMGLTEMERIVASVDERARARLRLVVLGGPAAGRTAIGGLPAFRAGFVHDVHRAIAGLDLLLHPGTAEGLGTAVIDALALGVPPVAFDSGSVAEIVEDARSGVLTPAGDDAAFGAAVTRLVTDGAFRASLAQAGPERAARFDPAHLVDGVLEVYGEVLRGDALTP